MLTSTRMPIRTLLGFVVGIASACGDASPARLVPLADPFVFNGPAAVALPVQAVTARGASVDVPMDASSATPTVAEVSGERLRCLRSGDSEIRVRSGSLHTSFVVQCRPILSFGPPLEALDLVLGGNPVPLAPVAYDSSGQRVGDLRFSATTADTAVIALQSGLVIPRRVGTATVRLDFGGIETVTHVEVVAAVVRDTLTLAAGEYRSWALGPGRYIARLEGAARAASTAISWRSANANCALDPRSRTTLHCVLADSGAVVVVAQATAAATVRIDRRAR